MGKLNQQRLPRLRRVFQQNKPEADLRRLSQFELLEGVLALKGRRTPPLARNNANHLSVPIHWLKKIQPRSLTCRITCVKKGTTLAKILFAKADLIKPLQRLVITVLVTIC